MGKACTILCRSFSRSSRVESHNTSRRSTRSLLRGFVTVSTPPSYIYYFWTAGSSPRDSKMGCRALRPCDGPIFYLIFIPSRSISAPLKTWTMPCYKSILNCSRSVYFVTCYISLTTNPGGVNRSVRCCTNCSTKQACCLLFLSLVSRSTISCL